jgi:hypothetical protein
MAEASRHYFSRRGSPPGHHPTIHLGLRSIELVRHAQRHRVCSDGEIVSHDQRQWERQRAAAVLAHVRVL